MSSNKITDVKAVFVHYRALSRCSSFSVMVMMAMMVMVAELLFMCHSYKYHPRDEFLILMA